MASSFNYPQDKKENNNFNYTESDDYTLDYPIFCFKHIDKKFGLEKCDKVHKKEFITRLVKLAELGFNEIYKSGRHQYGSEKIPVRDVKFKIPTFITEDVDFLYSYRYNGKKNPFLAYRRPNSAILHILAIDRNFSAYNHGS